MVNGPTEYIEQEVALSNKSIAKDLSYKHLKEDNKRLRAELHELRKMQAGWFGKDKVKKEVRIENHHYLHEKELLEQDIKTLTVERENMLVDIEKLRSENDALRAQIAKMKNNTNVDMR